MSDEGILEHIEHEVEEFIHGVDPQPAQVATPDAPPEPVEPDPAVQTVGDVAAERSKPNALAENVALQKGKDAVATLIARTSPAGPMTIDESITQGNRVVPASAANPADPLTVLTSRVKSHFAELTSAIDDVEALATRLRTLANKIGVGL